MIKINLLPPEIIAARAKKQTLTVPWREIIIAAVIAVAGISFWLPSQNMERSRLLEQLRAEWKTLEPKQQRMAEVEQNLLDLQRQADALQAAKNKQAQWAPRLSLLSEALVPQVWLTQLEYSQGKGLSLQGTALIGSAEEGGGQVTRFLQQLKEQPGFQDWFSGVEVESVEHRHIKEDEVADFVLLLTPTG